MSGLANEQEKKEQRKPNMNLNECESEYVIIVDKSYFIFQNY